MTTPERLRRRQLIEGSVLILLAIFTVVQAVAFSLEDRGQQRCVEEKFGELSLALDARADLTERESIATRRVFSVWGKAAGIVQDRPGSELTPAEEDELQAELVDALLTYQDEAEAIRQERQDNPLPPYPVGTCDQD